MACVRIAVVLMVSLSFFIGTVQPQKPTFLYVPSDEVVVLRSEYVSTSVKLHCYVINFDSSLTMLWYKNGIAISRNEDIVDNEHNLTDPARYSVTQGHNIGLFLLDIEEITTKTAHLDRGSYRCVVKNNGQVLTKSPSARVDIYVTANSGSEYPICTPMQSPHNYTEGATATVTCFTQTEITGTTLEWSRSDRNITLASSKCTEGEGGKYTCITEFVWTVRSEDDGLVYTCIEKNPHISTYPTCDIGPLIVSPPMNLVESMTFTMPQLIGIAVGGGLTLIAIIIIIAIIVVVVRRRKREDAQFPNISRHFEIRPQTDFNNSWKSGQMDTGASGPGLGIGTLTQDTGERYYKRKTMQTPINLDALSGMAPKSPNVSQSPSKTSLSQSEGKGSRHSRSSSVVDMATGNGDYSRPASGSVHYDVVENDPENYQTLSPREEGLYAHMNTLPLT